MKSGQPLCSCCLGAGRRLHPPVCFAFGGGGVRGGLCRCTARVLLPQPQSLLRGPRMPRPPHAPALPPRRLVFKPPMKEAVAVIIMASQKSAPVAVTVISYVTNDPAQQGLLSVPAIVGQLFQIFFGALLAKYLAPLVGGWAGSCCWWPCVCSPWPPALGRCPWWCRIKQTPTCRRRACVCWYTHACIHGPAYICSRPVP